MADMNLGSLNAVVGNYVKSGGFWLVVTLILIIAIVLFYGYFSRRSKLKYNCIEFVRFGNGKVGLNLMKAGNFGTKNFLLLFDYGREKVIKTSDNRIIQQAKSSHLHDVFGKKGYLCLRKPNDNKILVPLSKVDFDNMNLLLAIAPADYRDASVRIFNQAVEETKGTWEKLLPYIAIGLCIVMTIINVVVNMQMTNNTVNKVGDMLIGGCENAQNVKPTNAP